MDEDRSQWPILMNLWFHTGRRISSSKRLSASPQGIDHTKLINYYQWKWCCLSKAFFSYLSYICDDISQWASLSAHTCISSLLGGGGVEDEELENIAFILICGLGEYSDIAAVDHPPPPPKPQYIAAYIRLAVWLLSTDWGYFPTISRSYPSEQLP